MTAYEALIHPWIIEGLPKNQTKKFLKQAEQITYKSPLILPKNNLLNFKNHGFCFGFISNEKEEKGDNKFLLSDEDIKDIGKDIKLTKIISHKEKMILKPKEFSNKFTRDENIFPKKINNSNSIPKIVNPILKERKNNIIKKSINIPYK